MHINFLFSFNTPLVFCQATSRRFLRALDGRPVEHGEIILFQFLARLHISFSFCAFALHLKLKILKQNAGDTTITANEQSRLTMKGGSGVEGVEQQP